EPRSRELKAIQKKRENLVDVIKYEGIAQRGDSILMIHRMPESGRVAYFEEFITKLKKEDELKKALAEKELEKQKAAQNDVASIDKMSSAAKRSSPTLSPNAGQPGKPGDFYFYN